MNPRSLHPNHPEGSFPPNESPNPYLPPAPEPRDFSALWLSMVGNVKDTATRPVTFEACLEGIRSGQWQEQVSQVRAAHQRGDAEATRAEKSKLPAILFSGTFSRRGSEHLEAYSGLLCADIDDCEGRIPELREKIAKDPHVVAAFLSPTGTGLKVVFVVPSDSDHHAQSFAAVQARCRTEWGVDIDRACRDLARLCFVSFDPDLFFNPDAQCLPVTEPPPGETSPTNTAPASGVEVSGTTRERLESALEAIPADDYTTWRNVGFALYDWDPVVGLQLFDQWSKKSAKYTPDGVTNFWRSIKPDRVGDRVTLGTLFHLAEQNGWRRPLNVEEVARQYFFGDGAYWRKLPSGIFQPISPEQMKRELAVQHGCSPQRRKGEAASEADRVMRLIEIEGSVDGAAPFLHRPPGPIYFEGSRFLNISTVRCVEPAAEPGPWGERFPFIANLIDKLFDAAAKEHFLQWLSHFYGNAYRGTPAKGSALFIVGGPKRGKTLLSQKLVAGLVGGFADASAFLLNESRFNAEIFHKPVWAVDDSLAANDAKSHLSFSNLIKKFAANHEFKMEAKFRAAVKIPWLGRVVVTANDDAESIRILPDMELSNQDKISLIRVSPSAPEMTELNPGVAIERELPFFARFLLGLSIPEDKACSRFGVKAYHDPELLEQARQAGGLFPFAEILDIWRRFQFSAVLEDKSKKFIELTPTELFEKMAADLSPVKNSMRGYSAGAVGRRLSQMIAQGYKWVESNRSSGSRLYRIYNPSPRLRADQ